MRARYALALALLTPTVAALPAHSSDIWSIAVDKRRDRPLKDCHQLRINPGSGATQLAEERQTIPRSRVETLVVHAPAMSAIVVQGWTRREYSIRLCKAVLGADEAEAERIFSEISLSVDNGRVSFSGPADTQRWSAHLLIHVPYNAKLDLQSAHRPIYLHDVTGEVRVTTWQGHIFLNGVMGRVNADSHSGSISFSGWHGDVNLRTSRGDVLIDLEDNLWPKGGLSASTQTGRLTARIREDFQSRLRIEGNPRLPITCAGWGCHRRRWKKPASDLEMGTGKLTVRLSNPSGSTIVSFRMIPPPPPQPEPYYPVCI